MLKINSMKQVALFALIMFSALLFSTTVDAAKTTHTGVSQEWAAIDMGFGQPSSGLMKALFLGQSKKILGLIRRVFLVV